MKGRFFLEVCFVETQRKRVSPLFLLPLFAPLWFLLFLFFFILWRPRDSFFGVAGVLSRRVSSGGCAQSGIYPFYAPLVNAHFQGTRPQIAAF